ncbi:MAG: hypothetical protein AAGA42_08620 [Actinomycetota bacterium]
MGSDDLAELMPTTRYRRARRLVHRVASDRVIVQRVEPLGADTSTVPTAFDVTGAAALVFVALGLDSMTIDELIATIEIDVDAEGLADGVPSAVDHLVSVELIRPDETTDSVVES